MDENLKILRRAFAELGTRDPRVVAMHEAAHAVVGEHFGKTLVEIGVTDDPAMPGYTRMQWGPGLEPKQRRWLDAVICLAGPAADELLVGKVDLEDNDFTLVQRALEILQVPQSDYAKVLPLLREEAGKAFRQRIDEILEVMNLLLERKKLTRDELVAISRIPLFGQR